MLKNKFPVIILANPQLPENIGLSARAMMNCGFKELRIINPKAGWPNDKAIRSAAHGDDIIKNVKVYKNFKDSTSDLKFIIATSVRKRYANKKHFFEFNRLLKSINFSEKIGIIFGPERSGLTNKEISMCDCIFTIPVYNQTSSLNLSHAVLIVCYEVNKIFNKLTLKKHNNIFKKGSKKEFYNLMDHLKKELKITGFLYPKEKANNMFLNIQNMFIKANFSSQEIRTFRGILRRLRNPRKLDR